MTTSFSFPYKWFGLFAWMFKWSFSVPTFLGKWSIFGDRVESGEFLLGSRAPSSVVFAKWWKKKKKMVCCFLTLVSSDSLSCFDVFSPLELLVSSPVPWLSLEGGVACSFGEVVGPSAISHCCAVVPHPGPWIGSSPFQLLSLDYLAAFPVSFGNLGGTSWFFGVPRLVLLQMLSVGPWLGYPGYSIYFGGTHRSFDNCATPTIFSEATLLPPLLNSQLYSLRKFQIYRNIAKRVQSSRILCTQVSLLSTSYICMVHSLSLRNQYQYIIIH